MGVEQWVLGMSDNERHEQFTLDDDGLANLLRFGESLDMTGEGEWSGPHRPPDIEPDQAVHGLVFVVVGPDGSEHSRTSITAQNMDDVGLGERDAEWMMANPGSQLVVYDGDSGKPITALRPG